MALAWAEATQQDGQQVLEVRTGAGAPYYEIFLATRPELMQPRLARQRTADNFYSSRLDGGLLRADGGRAIFPLPNKLLTRFGNGRVHFVVKTYRDEYGNGPAVSPLLSLPPGQPILDGVDPSEDAMQYSSLDREAASAALGGTGGLFVSRPQSLSRPAPRATARRASRRAASRPAAVARYGRSSGNGNARPELAGALALVCERLERMTAGDPAVPGRPRAHEHARVLSHLLSHLPSADGQGSAAASLNAQIRGLSHPRGGARELEQSVLAARRRLTRGMQLNREAALPAVLAALGPALAQALPTILPALLPMLQQLLAQLQPSANNPPPAQATSLRDPLRASAALGRDGRSREQFFAALLPILGQILPSVLPMLAQLLPSLLGGLSRGRSFALTDTAALPAATLPATGLPPASGLPSTGTTPTLAPTVAPVVTPTGTATGGTSGAPAGSLPAGDQAALAGQIQAALAGAAAGGAGGGAAGGAPPIDPAAIGQLLQAAGGAGGINALAGGPGHELIKSVVDRLPIEKMFDGQAWIPQIKHDEWVQTMPWDKVLSLSSSASVVSALFVPGRRELDPLDGVELGLANRTLTKFASGEESWIFVSDEPARFELQIRAGGAAIRRPFVDVRVSLDGRARTGIQRSVFRVETVPAGQSTTLTIEVPPAVLRRALGGGQPLCLSIRLVEKTGDDTFRGTELRACFHAVARHSLVLSPGSGAASADELDALVGLAQPIPLPQSSGQPLGIEWMVDAVADGVDSLARYVPVRQRDAGGNATLLGGLQISPLGLADLARRLPGNPQDAERLAALKSALEADRALRQRLALTAYEMLEPAAQHNGSERCAVRTHFTAAGAFLVSFGGIGPHGNPSTRQVTPVRLPIPRGISVSAV
jgi:hypothetical protein